MKFLFLGGSSYLGLHLIKFMTEKGHEISAITRSEEATAKIKAVSHQAIILKEADLAKTESFDVVFNLVVDYGKNKELSDLIETNVLYPLRILEKISCKTILNFSTALNEDVSHYAFSKKQLEKSLIYLGEKNNWKVLNLHLQQFYGPRAPSHNFVSFVMTTLLSNQPKLDLTDGEQKRDFIYISDLLSAISVIISNLSNFEMVSKIEIGSGTSIRVRDFVEKAAKLTNSQTQLNFGAIPRRGNEPEELVADISVLKSLSWHPQYQIQDGISEIIRDSKNT